MNTPTFEEVDIDEVGTASPRTGAFWPIYKRLRELAIDREEMHDPDTPRRGLLVSFQSASSGINAVHRMGIWAAEDGWQIVYGTPDEGRRELHMIRPPEDSDAEV